MNVQASQRILYVKVAGVTFEGRQAKIAKLKGNEPVRLEPEPTNQFDPNAIAVKIATPDEILHVGYVPRDLAARIAPLLDGESLMVAINEITGGMPRFPTRGLILRVELPDLNLPRPVSAFEKPS